MRRFTVTFLVLLFVTAGTAAAVPPPAPGPYATLLFSRTEVTGAVGCVRDDTGVARLDTTVAPYLASLGLAGTGTLATARVLETGQRCTHARATLMSSWRDVQWLSSTYGWSFVSHTATYPANLATLSPARRWDETCGSAAELERRGLRGARGLIAYPGAGAGRKDTHTEVGAQCFAWGRKYGVAATTAIAAAGRAPYWQVTGAVNGGPCADPTASCATVAATGGKRYTQPAELVARVGALRAGQWLTLQAFLLVTDTSPAGSAIRWDCTADDPALHWTTDNERYCYRDWQLVVEALAARPDVTVTDPLTVGIAFGRPATYVAPPRPVE